MHFRLTLVFLTTLLFATCPGPLGLCAAQSGEGNVRAQGSGRLKQQGRERAADGDAATEGLRAQASLVLHGIVESPEKLSGPRSSATVVSNALDLLWKHEEAYARARLLELLDRFFDDYSSGAGTREHREQVADGIKTLISCLARHDADAGSKALARYEKLLAESAKNSEKLSLGDRLAVATASLDVDTKQSAALASRLLDAGVPAAFPDYLYKLEAQDEGAAARLYGEALSRLSRGAAYTPTHATILSAYAFREKLLVLEVRGRDSKGPNIEFGSFTVMLTPGPRAFNAATARAYLDAASRFLEGRLFALQQPGSTPDQEYVAQCYFLTRKLGAYAVRLSANRDGWWERLGSEYELLGQRAGLTADHLGGFDRLATRLVAEGNIFQFDDGAAAFEKASTVGDSKERTALLVRGVYELIDAEKFAEAEQKVGEIKDEDVTEPLTDYLNFRAGRAAARKRKWGELSDRSAKIASPQLRAYLLLEGAHEAARYGKRELTSNYLQSAVNVALRIDDKIARAKALVAESEALASLGVPTSAQGLSEAIRAINQAEGYDGGGYTVTVELPGLKLVFPLKDSDLAACFERHAKADWVVAINAAEAIGRGDIRAMAQIASCRMVL